MKKRTAKPAAEPVSTSGVALTSGRPSDQSGFLESFETPSPLMDRLRLRLDILCLVLGAISVMIFSLLTPPFQVPDEAQHFFRAYQVSELTLLPSASEDKTLSGGTLPSSVPLLAQKLEGDIPRHPERKMSLDRLRSALALETRAPRDFVNFPGSAVYHPLCYLPQGYGIAMARACGLPLLGCFYWGRLINGWFAVCLLALAIRLAPIGKEFFFSASFIPMLQFELASNSADALTISGAFLFIALLLHLRFQRIDVSTVPWLLALAAVGAGLASLKTAYVTMLPAAGLLCVGAPRRNWKGAVSVVLGGFAAAGSWSLIMRHFYVPMLPGTSPSAQVRALLSDPLDFASLAAGDLAGRWRFYWESMIGWLGWFDTKLPFGLLCLVSFALVLSISLSAARIVRKRDRIIATAVGLGSVVFLQLVTYILWNAPGARRIGFLQGRYFLPLLPFVAIALCSRVSIPMKAIRWAMAFVLLCPLVSLATVSTVLIKRYYLPPPGVCEQALPFGVVDTPGPRQVLHGSVPIRGWALAEGRIQQVALYIDRRFWGVAELTLDSPDIRSAYPAFPDSGKARWSATLDASALSPGLHDLVVQAQSAPGSARDIGAIPIEVK